MTALAARLAGHEKDIGGGFLVRRLLPDARQRSVGPFVFFDHFGPAQERPGVNHDVRPHPHIGLATVTDGEPLPLRQMAVLSGSGPRVLQAAAAARLVLVGGAPLDAPRHMWWNFVSSRKERILQASADWQAMRMGTVPGDAEFIPLPPTPATPAEPGS